MAHRHRIIWPLLAAWLLAPGARPDSSALAELEAARALARDGDLQGDWNKMLEARGRFARLSGDKTAAALAHYYLGYLDWRLTSMGYLATGLPAQVPLFERAARELSQAVEGPQAADAQALLAVVLGMTIGADQKRAAEVGPRLKAAWAAALPQGKENPRVLLLRAMAIYGTPKQHGGDPERGLEMWKEAIRLFEREQPAGPGMPDWGHAEAWGWLGGAHLMAGDAAKAAEAFDRALKLRPDFWWVQRIAAPQALRPALAVGP